MSTRLNKIISPRDSNILDNNDDISWVPKDPQEVLLPYMPEDQLGTLEKTDLDLRREKAKEVIDGYTKIINECKLVEAKIESKCKHVKIPLTRGKNLRVIESLGRVFGLGEIEEITFEMYKVCIRELAKIANDTGAP